MSEWTHTGGILYNWQHSKTARACTYKATDTKTQKAEIKRSYPKHIQYISKRYSNCLFSYNHTLSEGSSIEPKTQTQTCIAYMYTCTMYMYTWWLI